MRPLELRMSGLRSYRSEERIDFSDVALMAIVGDTGAGKSSILEAIFYALYGGCTWDQRGGSPLISDGAQMMQVELTFVADGRTWKVFRSSARSGQARHELQCLSEPELRFDNDTAVTAQIRKLVGLEPDAFLRTVILPQGRFQMLLQATKADRTSILKGIFRLEQLAAVREQADIAARRLRPSLEGLRDERSQLLPDPSASLADATARAAQAGERLTQLRSVSDQVSEASRNAERLERQAQQLGGSATLVLQAAVPGGADTLADLVVKAAEIDEAVRSLQSQRELHVQAVAEYDNQLQGAEDVGEGIPQLAAASGTLSSLREQLPGLLAEAVGCEQEAHAVDELLEKLARDEEALGEVEERVEQERRRVADARGAADTAAESLAEARSRLIAARIAAQSLVSAEIAAATSRDNIIEVTGRIEVASAAADEAAGFRQQTHEALESVQRAHAAAHAAEGRQPGDPCPICSHPLPAGFKPPVAPGERQARSSAKKAEEAARIAGDTLAEGRADLKNAELAATKANGSVTEARAALAGAIADLQEILAEASLDLDDHVVLAPLAEPAARLAEAATGQAEREALLGQVAAAKRSALQVEHAASQTRANRLSERRATLEGRRATFGHSAGSLPDRYAVANPFDDQALSVVEEQLELGEDVLREIERKRNGARDAAADASRQLDALTGRRRSEVEGPAQRLVPKIVAFSQRVDDLAGYMFASPPPQRPERGLSEDAAWVVELSAATEELLLAAEQEVARLKGRVVEQAVAIEAALKVAQSESVDALNEAIVETAAKLARANDDAEEAEPQIPRAGDLDRRIAGGRALVSALDELANLLSDSKFVGYVVARRQQTLLAIASEVLGSMSAGRYGFSESFEIIDRLTGLPRGVKTLSGGETFLASLALALGLVELAGRSGGRLDALFLDEGFGSLDANALTEALEALGRQAESGRMVAVISHLRSVAENIEHVLAVTRGPEGSRTHWLGGDEREQLIAEEIEAGLLS